MFRFLAKKYLPSHISLQKSKKIIFPIRIKFCFSTLWQNPPSLAQKQQQTYKKTYSPNEIIIKLSEPQNKKTEKERIIFLKESLGYLVLNSKSQKNLMSLKLHMGS